MGVSRIDLADAASPNKIVLEIFKHEPDLPIPVPIEALCGQLDISAIQPLQTAGYEGGLITDRDKSNGIILFNANSPETRKRFTIAHELGHFLIPSHIPSPDGKFLCSQQDMFRLSAGEQVKRHHMEVEANLFASRLLIPAKQFRVDVAASKDPDIQQVALLARRYNVSKEALGRAYAEFREEPTAVLITKDGKLLRSYVSATRFPFLSVRNGDPIPRQSLLCRRRHELGIASDLDETDAGVWIDMERGKRAPTLYEQVLPQQQGFAMILLTIEPVDEEDNDPDGDRTAKERLQSRQAFWRR
jgi:Zn-dependent peptidase ImmA (M78 family)